ncbi:hypothetical protein SAMN05421505_10318 [Sinosporangium album]|uniref:Uncharacterized protein n=1 Tax=Sinosporangium album TaxID=504805 RepID=A0A1G7SY44_9ACTN|nr:hypothetical protein SAMN05421505_10318 [Sinosporangium album]
MHLQRLSPLRRLKPDAFGLRPSKSRRIDLDIVGRGFTTSRSELGRSTQVTAWLGAGLADHDDLLKEGDRRDNHGPIGRVTELRPGSRHPMSTEPVSASPFVTRLRIRDFKSIASCDVALGPLTVLVGLNTVHDGHVRRPAWTHKIPETVLEDAPCYYSGSLWGRLPVNISEGDQLDLRPPLRVITGIDGKKHGGGVRRQPPRAGAVNPSRRRARCPRGRRW